MEKRRKKGSTPMAVKMGKIDDNIDSGESITPKPLSPGIGPQLG